MSLRDCFPWVLATFFVHICMSQEADFYLPREPKVVKSVWDVPCSEQYADGGFVSGCHPTRCGGSIRDDFISAEEVASLIDIAETGMQPVGTVSGPTIMDMNSGYVRSTQGLFNMYMNLETQERLPPVFARHQFNLYKTVVERIRNAIMEEFEIDQLWLTAPTFITRLIGDKEWTPQEIHDEYWHVHVDKNNTHHYDYSGLVYLSDYTPAPAPSSSESGDSEPGPQQQQQQAPGGFTGGLFTHWIDGTIVETLSGEGEQEYPVVSVDGGQRRVVEPAAGRLLTFTSGQENPHQVEMVESGTRYVMALWFTCEEARHFDTFLDGQAHIAFDDPKQQQQQQPKRKKKRRRRRQEL